MEITIFDRIAKIKRKEKIFGKKALTFLYERKGIFSQLTLFFLSHFLFFSQLYGYWHRTGRSKKKILPFIKSFDIDPHEFEQSIDSFSSFNDFFIRKLKASARPIIQEETVAIMPADARYLVFPNLENADGFYVKGKKFHLKEFLKDEHLEEKYRDGTMVIARLAPMDYHRFHFPFTCSSEAPKLINGFLFSVNPIAVSQNIEILSQNKRMVTVLLSKTFGEVLFIEIGATNVGSIQQTFEPGRIHNKGEEKGYFALGGSCIVMLFEKDRIELDQDLLENSEKKMEVRGLFGQSLGRSLKSSK